MSVIGGPRDVSMPCPLKDAGGLRVAGERASLPEAAGCGEKYEGEVADDADACVGVSAGVEGFVARRDRGDAEAPVELLDGRRRSVGVSGAVLLRWCLGGEGWRPA